MIFLLLLCLSTFMLTEQKGEPDLNMKVPEMITFRGYREETHFVTTKDCYIITLHRILLPEADESNRGQPILLMHGLMGSSAEWVMNSIGGRIDDQDNLSLAFVLARAGFDVWLGNNRGNEYSTKHVKYSTESGKYWNFNIDHFALRDLPAMLGHIQKKTHYNKISYVGYSQGSKQMMEALSLEPKLANHLEQVIFLGPVTRVKENKSALKKIAWAWKGLMKLKPRAWFKNNLFHMFPTLFFCNPKSPFSNVCARSIFSIPGYTKDNLNFTRKDVYLNHFPNQLSIMNFIHYLQHLQSGDFTRFDMGSKSENSKCYGQNEPPKIPLKNVELKEIITFYSEDDKMAAFQDYKWTKEQMGEVKFQEVPMPKKWQHLDFELSNQADKVVNEPLLKMLRNIKPPWIDDDKLPSYDEENCDNEYSNLCKDIEW